MNAPSRIVCLGGGYVATYLCRALRRAVEEQRVDLTVISRENYHAFHGFVAEMLTGKLQPSSIISPARRVFAPARFHNAEIESIDLEKQTVTTSRSLDGRQYVVPYDHLVLAVGSVDDLSRIAGVAEHALRLKTYADCFDTRNQILTMLELAEIEEDPEERRRLLTFVIAGGNYAGIEVATELAEYLHDLTQKEYRRIALHEARVVIVHSGEGLLPELRARHPSLVRAAERYIRELGAYGLEVRLKTRLASATSEEAILNTGERIPTRTIISCTGTAQSPLLETLPFERDERGRVITDPFCKVRGTSNVWAAGDCAAVPLPSGHTAPMLASYAIFGGLQIGKNILNLFEGQPLEPYRFTGIGDAVSLGRRKAVGHIRGIIPVTGFQAWVLWRALMFSFLPAWDLRVRVVFDWMSWPVIGRSVVRMQGGKRSGVESALYEPGQVIVKQGDVGRYVYVIQSGKVEVVQTQDHNEQLLAVLGPGDHFGETAVFDRVRRTATVRAQTRVKLLVLGQQEAVTLSAAIEPLGKVIRRVPRKPSSRPDPEEASDFIPAP